MCVCVCEGCEGAEWTICFVSLPPDDVSNLPPKKKKSSKKRKKANTGETPPIATPTTQPYVDSSDSEAEYHDAWSDLPGEITGE